jgi:predicted secreted protein
VGSSGTFTACAGVINITPPSYSRGTVDVTSHGTTDYYEQAISGGPIRSGNVGISAVFLSTATQQVTTIPTDFNAGTRSGWKIELAGASSANTVWYGDGYVTSYQMTVPGEGLVGFDMQMKITGRPTISTSTT